MNQFRLFPRSFGPVVLDQFCAKIPAVFDCFIRKQKRADQDQTYFNGILNEVFWWLLHKIFKVLYSIPSNSQFASEQCPLIPLKHFKVGICHKIAKFTNSCPTIRIGTLPAIASILHGQKLDFVKFILLWNFRSFFVHVR